jgi:hypothetical protein
MMQTKGYGAWERQEFVDTMPTEPAELARYIRDLELTQEARGDGIQRGCFGWPLAVAILLVWILAVLVMVLA